MRRISYLMILFAAGVFMACGDDDGPAAGDIKIDIDNPDQVSSSLTIENAVRNEGDPPGPSSDPDAPSLFDNSGQEFGAVSGKSFYLDPSVNQGEPAGIYFQVKGSSEYFDISLTTGSSGGRFGTSRLFKNSGTAESDVVEIKIPDNLEPGVFCALYCIYDAEGRVSNAVEICIEIIGFGGDGADFFSGQSWELVSLTYTEDGQTRTEVPGQDYEENREASVSCFGQFQTVEVTETYRTNYLYLTFSDNGAWGVEAEIYEREFDEENSTCQEFKYTEATEIETETGVWTYDEASKSLTVVSEYVDEFDGQTYTDIFKAQIDLVDGQLVITNEDEGESEEIIFKKKE